MKNETRKGVVCIHVIRASRMHDVYKKWLLSRNISDIWTRVADPSFRLRDEPKIWDYAFKRRINALTDKGYIGTLIKYCFDLSGYHCSFNVKKTHIHSLSQLFFPIWTFTRGQKFICCFFGVNVYDYDLLMITHGLMIWKLHYYNKNTVLITILNNSSFSN